MKTILLLALFLISTSQALASGCMGYGRSYELGKKLNTEEVSGSFACAARPEVLSCEFTTVENTPRKFHVYLANSNSRLPVGVTFPVVIETYEAMEYDDCSYDGRYRPNGTYERFFIGSMEIFRFIP